MPCMYPHPLCNVDVMISTLQKRLQDALLSLVEPSSSFRIGSHLRRDTAEPTKFSYSRFELTKFFSMNFHVVSLQGTFIRELLA